jgi:hypothetical protein
MTIYHTQRDVAAAVSPTAEPAVDLEGRDVMSKHNWRDGRLVLPRPEARNSVIAKSYIEQTPEQADAFTRGLVETVARERGLSAEQRADELQVLAAMVNLPAG